MKPYSLPPKQGLYDPNFEHDACGIGFVAHIKGKKSNEIVRNALTILTNLDHRGGQGAETNTGDGAGILLQVPHKFLVKEMRKKNIALPDAGGYGVGMVFFTPDPDVRKQHERAVETIISEEGQKLIGWRTVPTDNTLLGDSAKSVEPFIRQVFIAPGDNNSSDSQAFERKLFIIRKRAEQAIRFTEGVAGGQYFYFTSLSSSTIVYKGMLTTDQMDTFYLDLRDPAVESALALVHSRFSTNTFPSWERAHPNRYLIHNGEINTLRGNENWMHARQAVVESEIFGDDLKKIMPIIDQDGSDSSKFDNVLEFMILSGRSLPHVAMMMIPEPWAHHETMNPKLKAFYEYHSCLMEPWDGPAAMAFSDGKQIAALLDRNGLRPARYYVTKDDMIILASEVGVLDIAPEDVVLKDRLRPGKILLIDTEQGRIISDEEVKSEIVSEHPYQEWLHANLLQLDELEEAAELPKTDLDSIVARQRAFGYTYEDKIKLLSPMASEGVEPMAAMGVDTPLAVLSDRPQMLYNYFQQLFAQVTNPPIDALREEIVTSTITTIGAEGNLLKPTAESAKLIQMKSPMITNAQLAKLRHNQHEAFKVAELNITFPAAQAGEGLERAIEALYAAADKAIDAGATLLILSDRGISEQEAPIPALLAVSALHHHLIRQGTRTKASLILESGEPREVHHFALLLGYGVSAINPYLALETIEEMIGEGLLTDIELDKAVYNYMKAGTKGVVKVLSKMGISTIQSYRGAQIFEAIGLATSLVDKYFTWTPTRIGGIDIHGVAKEAIIKHAASYSLQEGKESVLPAGGEYNWRKDGEEHLFNPETIHALQSAVRTGSYETFKTFSKLINAEDEKRMSLRGLLRFKKNRPSVSIEEVESVESIVRRFKSGAMSYGSISKEAHESLAIAMNRIGGKSNTGEGGEDPRRFTPDENGDLRRSSIKQVASGRFGVTSHYLVNADEIQIKMAQGAKPGEGGQLPGKKVYPWIAEVRGSTTGVGLISPPPHHDIYSIEDLAELIHDLKNANPRARINVKLVSEVGVGTIAAGVAKGRADVVLISGYDGGTGASPRTSIKHAGLPWELGLAETHQTLLLNNLRDRIVVETDGKLMTGRDVVIATLLGAEEYGFATAPLVALGCVMMRVCHMDTCPVGVATQNPELRKNFAGKPEHVVNFMLFIAQEVRELMAELGYTTINEMVGDTSALEAVKAIDHWKAQGVDLSPLLYQPDVPVHVGRYQQIEQDHGLSRSLDVQELVGICEPALARKEEVHAVLPIRNINRVVGTILGSEITRRYGAEGLPDHTIKLHFRGSAGQSMGAFLPKGVTISLEGDANDYYGKGLSGGRLIVYPSEHASFKPEENVIVGNVALYGATGGEAYIQGIAGERFAVRNSGVRVVVEGVGDHGCEYMTGGRVVVLGETGRNFAAGMSGGIAYVLPRSDEAFRKEVNQEMVLIESLEEDAEIAEVKGMIRRHVKYTGSKHAERILNNWQENVWRIVKIIPKDYKRMVEQIELVKKTGLVGEAALLAAFEANARDLSRVGGN
jgi:glutamate synthase (NADPH/NADH) large chain